MGPVRHPCKFQQVSRLGSVTARQSSSGRQPNFAAFIRRRHLCSAGRPSGWALAHILVPLAITKLHTYPVWITKIHWLTWKISSLWDSKECSLSFRFRRSHKATVWTTHCDNTILTLLSIISSSCNHFSLCQTVVIFKYCLSHNCCACRNLPTEKQHSSNIINNVVINIVNFSPTAHNDWLIDWAALNVPLNTL